MGLNDSYCAPRGNILMILPFPSIPNAYALLMQEEQQREVQNCNILQIEITMKKLIIGNSHFWKEYKNVEI